MINLPEMRRIIFADLIISLGPGTTAALYLFFFHDARGYTAPQTNLLLVFYIVAGLIGAPFWGWLGGRIGKHRALMVSALAYVCAQSALMAIPRQTMALAIPGMFAVGFVASAFIPVIRAMVADVADAARLNQGQDRTSLLYAMVTTTQKIGLAITVGISFAILQAVGFNAKEGAVNTPHAVAGLEACYVFVPVIFALIGGSAFFGYKLDAKRHAAIRAALDARDALAAEPTAAAEGLTGVDLPATAA
jgi:Na+/melibiose symporter-like transporter